MRADCGHDAETVVLLARHQMSLCVTCWTLGRGPKGPVEPVEVKRPRQSREEAVLKRRAKAEAVAKRREFHARRKAEKSKGGAK